ncbi:hypothetical protein HPB47_011354 [Ixodes persulcatus]|uniref:Uncharacterized protein n=1 Tax=Ixodes persulcatus TaxID=34615 RepID=A0AC60NWV3_IXOPE|nr:hypothetical protein HPB47_011354 [Ixodes persulcatus]
MGCAPVTRSSTSELWSQEPEKSRAWQTARALGARVSSDLCPGVTHLVAARPGTAKVNRARRTRQLHVVSPAWLWCCAERWEHVHEALFPLEAEAPAEGQEGPEAALDSRGNYQKMVAGIGDEIAEALETLCPVLGRPYSHDMLEEWTGFANFVLESENQRSCRS